MMFGLFGKLKVYLIMAVGFAAFAGVAYWYYKDSQAALALSAQNQAKLQLALETEQQTINSLTQDIESLTRSINSLNQEFNASREAVRSLERRFNQDDQGNSRNFGELAEQKPEEVEQAVNKGTQEVFRCIEILAGADTKESDYDNEYIDCLSSGDNTNSMQ